MWVEIWFFLKIRLLSDVTGWALRSGSTWHFVFACVCVCGLASWSFVLDVYMLWLLHADVLDSLGLAVGLAVISEHQYIPIIVCVCVISQAKKKQRIKEPPWISMNTFTVIKHSSKIQHWSGRQFPLQSYVPLRDSMGLGLTDIIFFY